MKNLSDLEGFPCIVFRPVIRIEDGFNNIILEEIHPQFKYHLCQGNKALRQNKSRILLM